MQPLTICPSVAGEAQPVQKEICWKRHCSDPPQAPEVFTNLRFIQLAGDVTTCIAFGYLILHPLIRTQSIGGRNLTLNHFYHPQEVSPSVLLTCHSASPRVIWGPLCLHITSVEALTACVSQKREASSEDRLTEESKGIVHLNDNSQGT